MTTYDKLTSKQVNNSPLLHIRYNEWLTSTCAALAGKVTKIKGFGTARSVGENGKEDIEMEEK